MREQAKTSRLGLVRRGFHRVVLSLTIVGTIAVMFTISSSTLRGQTPKRRTLIPTAPREVEIVSYEIRETRTLGESRYAVMLVGHVQIRFDDVWLRCDNAVGWIAGNDETDKTKKDASKNEDKKQNRIRLTALYAEGTVVFQRSEEFVECHEALLDLRSDRALFLEATLATKVPTRDQDTPLVVRAAQLRQLEKNLFEGVDVKMTTCAFGRPHYHLHTDSVRAQIDPVRPNPLQPGESVRNVRVELDSSVLRVGGSSFLAAPPYVYNTASAAAGQFGWVKSVDVGSSSRFGPSVRVTLGDDLEFGGKPWGRLFVRPQVLLDRGPGLGIDLDYRRPDYHGEFTAEYQHDDGEDRIFGSPPSSERGRVLWRHRHRLPEHVQVDVEFSIQSDEGYLPEYHEDEFKSGKEQETLIYVKRALENRAATLLANVRTNSFLDQVEHLPQVGYNLISEPLFDIGNDVTVYFDADYEAGYLRNEIGNRLPGRSTSYRLDFDNLLSAPFHAGPVKVRPFVGLRYSRYGNDRLDSDDIDRFGTQYGVQLTTQLHRTFDATGGLFDLRGLRHIVLPEITYRHVNYVSTGADNLIQFDDIDAFDEVETVTFGLRNRLQTIWNIDGIDEVVDIVDLDVEWTWFADSDHFNERDGIGNLDVDLLFRPSRKLTFVSDFEYNFREGGFDIFNATLGWAPSKEVQLALSYRRFVGVNDAVFLTSNFRFSEKWALLARTGYDFVEDAFQDQRLILQRIGHDFVFEVELSFDGGADDFGVAIGFTPRALFDPRLKARSIRNEPRFWSFGEGLVR